MASTFGKTWWGNAWLQALTDIDFSNRIPRGARYARNGAVRSVAIEGNEIEARVDGTRPTPYKIHLEVKPFTAKETNRLVEGIMSNPIVVSQLLNMKLSPMVMDIAQQAHLEVFPSSWKDLRMQCSCPDWAVPCKHIAAVIYMISVEIDNNPFLVFQLHGIDLLKELKQRGLGIDVQQNVAIAPWKELLSTMDADDSENTATRERSIPDFTKIEKVGNALLSLLPDTPPFYTEGDFRKLYIAHLGKIQRLAAKLLLRKKTLAETYGLSDIPTSKVLRSTAEHQLTLRDGLRIDVSRANAKTKAELWQLMLLLDGLDTEAIEDCSNSIFALKMCYLMALHLLKQGNICPQVYQNKDKSYNILWVPAATNGTTGNILQQLEGLFSSNTVRMQWGKGYIKATRQPAWVAVAVMLTHLMGTVGQRAEMANKPCAMFFRNLPQTFGGVSEAAMPLGMKSWVDHLSIPDMRWRPVVMVSDEHDDAETFLLELAVEDTQSDDAHPILLHEVFAQSALAAVQLEVLKDLSLLSPLIKGLDTYFSQKASQPLRFNNSDFTHFLLEVIPVMRLLNIKLLLPKSLQRLLHPRPSVKLSAKPQDGKSHLRLDQLLQFDWRIAIGDTLLLPDEFERLSVRAGQLLRFKGQYVYVSPDDLKTLEKALTDQRAMPPGRMLQIALSREYNGAKVKLTDEVMHLIAEWTQLQDIPVPAGIHAQLRPYQKRGYAWMYHNLRLGFGSILADDMGLGKTLQVITLLQKLKDDQQIGSRSALVIAPTGLLANWQAELQRFAPSLSVHLYHGSQRDLKDFHHDVLLTSYGLVRADVDKLKKLKWTVVVIDEAQNIKNRDTAQSKAVCTLKADAHIAMSGTPVENRLSEYWSIMDFANKGYLGTAKTFQEEYAKPIQDFGDHERAERFRKITAPMMMRRLKTDKHIIDDLPDKIEQDEFAMLTSQQAALYQQVLQESMKVIEGMDDTDSHALFKRQGLILQMILALKQICNHPSQYLKDGNVDASLSGKTEMLLDLVDAIREQGEKAIIFTQFREMGTMLQQFITERTGVAPMFLHGGCTIKQRAEMVDRFQHNRADRVFILSLKAAGTGLNLTAATHVIHYDLWWNPAVEAQATDRAYRIGQQKNVIVHRFITKNTFEERINDLINNKRELANLTVAAGENWIGKLSNSELKALFG